jgi:hypothetical protein
MATLIAPHLSVRFVYHLRISAFCSGIGKMHASIFRKSSSSHVNNFMTAIIVPHLCCRLDGLFELIYFYVSILEYPSLFSSGLGKVHASI